MLYLNDITFREGKQSTLGGKLGYDFLKYSSLVFKLGVQTVELMYPFISKGYLSAFRKTLKRYKGKQVLVHAPISLDIIQKLIVDNVSLFRISQQTENVLSDIDTIDNIFSSLGPTTKLRLECRLSVSIDKLRDRKLLHVICKRINQSKYINSLILADSDGSALPEEVLTLLQTVSKYLSVRTSLGLHLHNDIGLAAANFYSAFSFIQNQKRSIYVDVSLAGIGERNGVLSIADVFAILYRLDPVFLHRHYSTKLYGHLLKKYSQVILFQRDPICQTAFAHTSGVHIRDNLQSGKYGKLDPSRFGLKRYFIFNESTSSSGVGVYMKSILKKSIDPQVVKAFTDYIRNLSNIEQRDIREDEVRNLYTNFNKRSNKTN